MNFQWNEEKQISICGGRSEALSLEIGLHGVSLEVVVGQLDGAVLHTVGASVFSVCSVENHLEQPCSSLATIFFSLPKIALNIATRGLREKRDPVIVDLLSFVPLLPVVAINLPHVIALQLKANSTPDKVKVAVLDHLVDHPTSQWDCELVV